MKRLLLCMLLLAGMHAAQAQYYKTDTTSSERKGFDPSRLMVGGTLGLTFGSYTNINVSPDLGYRFSEMFAAGATINFQYASEKWEYTNGTVKNSYNVYGGGLWGRFYPFEMLFLHAQPELNYVSVKITDNTVDPKSTVKESHTVPSLLLGGGYSQPLGEGGGSSFYIMVLYDVIQETWSPYQNRPVFRMGFNIGL